jgi:hypothetical protein
MLTAKQPIVAVLGSLKILPQTAGPGQPSYVLSALHSAQGGIGRYQVKSLILGALGGRIFIEKIEDSWIGDEEEAWV